MTYSINAWGSNPELNNDDCFYGEDCQSFLDILEVLKHPKHYFNDSSIEYVEIDSYGFYSLIKNPNFKSKRNDLSLEYSEGRMQAGMMGGVQAYNDYCGYDSTDYNEAPYSDYDMVEDPI